MTLHPPSLPSTPPGDKHPSGSAESRQEDPATTAPADLIYRIAAITATLFVVATLF